jgi:uncharacterized protein YwbE
LHAGKHPPLMRIRIETHPHGRKVRIVRGFSTTIARGANKHWVIP